MRSFLFVCRSVCEQDNSQMHLRMLTKHGRHLRRYVTDDCFRSLVVSLIHSTLDNLSTATAPSIFISSIVAK